MAFKFRHIPQYILIVINILVCMAMNLCAYSQYLPPARFESVSYIGMLFPVFLLLTVCFMAFWLVVTKWRLCSVSLCGMLLCAGSVRTYCPINIKSDIPEGAIKVLSYNVMIMQDDTDPDPAKTTTAQYLRRQDADIVCLQEAPQRSEEVAEWLKDIYPYCQVNRDKNTILTCLSKHPILSATRIEYESIANCSYAYRIAIQHGGDSNRVDTVLVVNNHLEGYHLLPEDKTDYKTIVRHVDDEDNEIRYFSLTSKLCAANAIRSLQADSVAHYVDTQKEQYKIVCGDFNDTPISYTHHRLTRTLNDTFSRSGCGLGISYNKNGMYFRIDNILVSPNIQPCETQVDHYSKISDHYPIISWVKLQ